MTRGKFKFICLIILFIVIVTFIIEKFGFSSVYENVYTVDSDNFDSGDGAYGYSAMVTEDNITFFDQDGNSIIYVFEANRLANVFNVYNAETEAKAKKIAAYYEKQVGNGEIYDVSYKGNIVSVQMDINFFAEYKNYTKKEIENILLNKDKNNLVEGVN